MFIAILTTTLRSSYDNAMQSYDRLTTDVQFTKYLTKNARLFLGTIR